MTSLILVGCKDNLISTDNTTTVKKDTTTLRVINVVPISNVPVSDTMQIVVSFSAPLDSKTVSSVSVKILQDTSPVSFNIKASGNKIILSPVSNLAYVTTYSGVITTAVKDTGGNTLPAAYSWSFTTVGLGYTPWNIPDGQIADLTTDASGNVYVTGTFDGGSNGQNCFVAQFNPSGKLVWRQNITTAKNDYPVGGIVVANGTVYVHIDRADGLLTDGGAVSTDAYVATSGAFKWSAQTGAAYGDGLAVDASGNVYSVGFTQVMKLDPNGNILRQYRFPRSTDFHGISVTADAVFLCGETLLDNSLVAPLVVQLDLNLNAICQKQGTAISPLSEGESIISVPEDSLIFVGESYGDIMNGVALQTSVICYKIRVGGLDSVWQKPYDGGHHIGLKKDGADFYVFSRDVGNAFSGSVNGPIEMFTSGSILWTASPKKNGCVAVFNGKVFIADGSSTLTVYN